MLQSRCVVECTSNDTKRRRNCCCSRASQLLWLGHPDVGVFSPVLVLGASTSFTAVHPCESFIIVLVLDSYHDFSGPKKYKSTAAVLPRAGRDIRK